MAGVLIENPVKSGWLSMQLPNTNVFKNYYVILRSSTLDFYSGLKEAEKYPSVTQRQILLKNCLIIQALKKGAVKHGFTLLLVPEGLYVICASSESEKNVWLRIIRQTISDQAKLLSQADKQKRSSNDPQPRNKADLLKSPKMSSRIQINRGKTRVEKEVTDSNSKNTLRKNETEGIPFEGREKARLMPEVKNGMRRKNSPRDLVNSDAKNTTKPNGESHTPGLSDFKILEHENLDTLSISETLSISSVRVPATRQKSTNSQIRLLQQSNPKLPRNEQNFPDVQSTKTTKSVTDTTPSVIYPSTPTIVDIVDQRKQITPHMKPQRRQPETERLERKAYDFSLFSPGLKRNSHASRQDSPGTELISSKSQFKRKESLDSSGETLSNFNRDNIRIDRVSQDGDFYNERQKQSQSIKWDKTEGVKKTGSITILRENEPIKEVKRIEREFVIEVKSPIPRPPVSPPSSSFAQANDSSLSKHDSLTKSAKEHNSGVQWKNTGVAPVQSSILNFRKSVSRWKPLTNESKKLDSAKAETTRIKETEKSLILENQALTERLKVLSAQKVTSNVHEQTISKVEVTSSQTANGVRRLQKHSPEMVRFLDRSVLSETQERPNRSSSVDSRNTTITERVEAWLRDFPQIPVNEQSSDKYRKKRSPHRRKTTSDIPPMEEIRNLKLAHTDALPLITQQASRPTYRVDHYGTVGHNAYARSPKSRRRNVNTCFQATFPSVIENELSVTSTPLTNRLSSQCISEPIDPKYTSTMWCRLVELWSNLLNEERYFWRTQVQQLFLRSCNSTQKDSSLGTFENDASMLIELLDKTNRRHTEQTVALWKHIYESWVPHDYLNYFADETRKNLTCLHAVINRLFELIDNARQTGGSEPVLFDRQLTDLKNQLMGTKESLTGFAMSRSSNPGGDRVNSCSSGVLETTSPHALSHAQSKLSQLSSDSWQQTRMLLKESHSQLLEQVYNVAEMVGTALDVDMEDSISGAQKLQEKLASADPLSSLPTTGLQVAAKLQAVVLDLETRLEAICQQDTADENSVQLGQQQPLQSIEESPHPLKPEVDSRTVSEAVSLKRRSDETNVINGQPTNGKESTNGDGNRNVWSRNVQKFYENDT